MDGSIFGGRIRVIIRGRILVLVNTTRNHVYGIVPENTTLFSLIKLIFKPLFNIYLFGVKFERVLSSKDEVEAWYRYTVFLYFNFFYISQELFINLDLSYDFNQDLLSKLTLKALGPLGAPATLTMVLDPGGFYPGSGPFQTEILCTRM